MSPCPPPVVSYHKDGPRFHQVVPWEPPKAYFRDVRIERYPAHIHPVVRPISTDNYSADSLVSTGTLTIDVERHEGQTVGYAGFWYEDDNWT